MNDRSCPFHIYPIEQHIYISICDVFLALVLTYRMDHLVHEGHDDDEDNPDLFSQNKLALAMGLHRHLGQNSLLKTLSPQAYQHIVHEAFSHSFYFHYNDQWIRVPPAAAYNLSIWTEDAIRLNERTVAQIYASSSPDVLIQGRPFRYIVRVSGGQVFYAAIQFSETEEYEVYMMEQPPLDKASFPQSPARTSETPLGYRPWEDSPRVPPLPPPQPAPREEAPPAPSCGHWHSSCSASDTCTPSPERP